MLTSSHHLLSQLELDLETQILFSMGLESLSKTNELLASGQQLNRNGAG